MIDLPPPDHAQTIAAVVQCGVRREDVSVHHSELLQSEVVRIIDLGEVTEAKVRCIRKSVHPSYVVEPEDPDQYAAYSRLELAELGGDAEVEGRRWLGERGLLGRVPSFSPDRGILQFARDLETACSVEPGSVLEVYSETLLTVRQGFAAQLLKSGGADTMICLSHLISVSNAEESGISFGFIGNSAPDEGPGQ